MQVIADKAAGKNLAPANGTDARYRMQEWLNFTTSELHKNFSPLFNPAIPTQAKAIERARELSSGTSPHVERVRNTTGGSPDKWREP